MTCLILRVKGEEVAFVELVRVQKDLHASVEKHEPLVLRDIGHRMMVFQSYHLRWVPFASAMCHPGVLRMVSGKSSDMVNSCIAQCVSPAA